MRARVTLALSFALLSLMLAAGAALADHPGGGGVPLSATLAGANEVPGPGHPTATGTASFRLNPGQEEICYELAVAGLDGLTVSGAHIHQAPATGSGPIVVRLANPTSGASSGCVFAPRALILAIIRNPEAYYVNVHAVLGFGPGAVRGQLSRGH
jgi:hypothetical protein